MATKKQLHTIVDQLAEGELHVAMRFLEYLTDLCGDQFSQVLVPERVDDQADEDWHE